MKNKKIIGYVLLGGVLMKILHNQKIIDDHIRKSSSGYYIDYHETIEENTITKKVCKKLYKLFNKDE